MADNAIIYEYPPPTEWRKHMMPDGIQFRVRTSDGTRKGAALVIAHADLIRETFGEGDALKVAREHSDEILKWAKELIERLESPQLDRVYHLYDPKISKAS